MREKKIPFRKEKLNKKPTFSWWGDISITSLYLFCSFTYTHTQCESWPSWPRVNLREHSPTCTEIPWFLLCLTSANPSAGIRIVAPFPALLLPCFSSLLFVSRIFSSLLGVYFTLLGKSPDHVSLSHTVYYWRLLREHPSQRNVPVQKASGQLSWPSIITSAAHVSSERWVVSLLHTFLGLKRRVGLKTNIFHANKVGYS